METALQFPVTMLPHRFPAAFQEMPRQHFPDSLEHPLSVCFRRTKTQHLAQPFPVHSRFHSRITEDALDFRGKNNAGSPFRIKTGLHPQPVTEQVQFPLSPVPNGKGENAVQALDKIHAMCHITCQQNLRVAVSGKFHSFPLQFLS